MKPQNIYWLGGGSGGGKSTIARRLAEKHGMVLYASDQTMGDHGQRVGAEECPQLDAFKKMTMDERWVTRSPQVMLETFHWFRGEGFRCIVEDLAAMPDDARVIVEGFRLLPALVKPHLADSRHAAWLIPTGDFRRAAFESRGTLWSIANQTSRPEIALRNLLERDHMFTERLAREVPALGLTAIAVDAGVSEDELLRKVEAQFGL